MANLPDAPVEHEPPMESVQATLKSLSDLFSHAIRPLPTEAGDGTYIEPTLSTGLLRDLETLNIQDVDTLNKVVKEKFNNNGINDKDYLMERVIQVACELPSTSKKGTDLTNGFICKLWDALPHPPATYLGDGAKYREADGSKNNFLFPQMGAAGTPYARSVKPQTIQKAALPDPGVLFDSVMARKEFEPHPNGVSSMLFYLASIIIHDLFRTDHKDFNISLTSSYLDLAPLYGSNQEEQDQMRTFEDGKIKPDCFSEKRLLGFPPGVGVMLIMFNRFHNFVVEKLALINENNKFTKPSKDDAAKLKKYDNDLFQTGRLVTCGLYVNCILKDYVRTILNINRTDSLWDLDPRSEEKKSLFNQPAASGTGNQVSAEFNLVYRWHAAISERDEKWTEEQYRRLFKKDAADLSLYEILGALKEWESSLAINPQERSFADLKRGEDGKLDEDGMVKILTDSIKDVAGSFGANRVPKVLRSVEILGIIQARSWNLATLNEFRAFFGLKKHETFEDINSDQVVADQLKHLYDTPDLVELYPGLVVEEAKKPVAPGSGLCPSYTVSRAILSDAVTLVRGDRYYTTDYTPKNLTSWGFKEASFDLSIDQGCVFYKVILRAFPKHFKQNSVFAHYPLVVPSENRKILEHLGRDDEYDFEDPKRIPDLTLVTSHEACKKILENKEEFKVTWGEAICHIMNNSGKMYGADFALSGDEEVHKQSRDRMVEALHHKDWHQEIKTFYEKITLQLLHEHSYKLAGVNEVDIVRDVGNLAQAHFSAEVFSLPLKTKDHPLGIYSEQELYLVMALVFTCIFYDADVTKSFLLRQAARKVTQQLGNLMEAKVHPFSVTGLIAEAVERFHRHDPLSSYGIHMIQALLKKDKDVKDVVWSQILPTAGGMVANQGQLFAQTLDYYLSEEGKPHLKEINRLAKLDTPEADELLLRYFMEGSRLHSCVGLYRTTSSAQTIHDGPRTLTLPPNSRLMVDLVTASHDPATFPDPDTVRLDRPMDSYIHYGMGPHQCLGYDISKLAMTTMLKTVARLEGLRRAPGPQGEIKKVRVEGGFELYLTADGSGFFPFPTTMKVRWDGELPPLK